ncbi:MAG: DUF4188 domain-containing protein [Xenococcaceae cyanobacterium]
MKQASYQIDLPEKPEAVVFVNGIKAENLLGCLWLWKQSFSIRKACLAAAGCKEVKAGKCSLQEVVIVSYWQDEASLMSFFHSRVHRQMMKEMMGFLSTHPQALSLYNETYRPLRSGKYFQKPHGLAKMYQPVC